MEYRDILTAPSVAALNARTLLACRMLGFTGDQLAEHFPACNNRQSGPFRPDVAELLLVLRSAERRYNELTRAKQ